MASPAGLTEQQNRTLLFVLPLVLAIGLGLTIWGGTLTHFHIEMARNGILATGTVIDLEAGSSSGSGSSPSWFPIVQYKAADGAAVTFRHRTGRTPPAYQKGDSVTVIYLANDPATALIHEPIWNWVLPVVLMIIGPGLTILGLIGTRRAWRRRNSFAG